MLGNPTTYQMSLEITPYNPNQDASSHQRCLEMGPRESSPKQQHNDEPKELSNTCRRELNQYQWVFDNREVYPKQAIANVIN